MEIAILLALIVLNGLLAMAEIALVTARKARLQKQVDDGDRLAAAANFFNGRGQAVAPFTDGLTDFGLMCGAGFGEAALAAPFAEWLESLGVRPPWAGYAATALVVVVVTYVSIVVGELVPKRLGKINPEGIARMVAHPMTLLATVSKPFVRLLSVSTELILRGLGARSDSVPSVTEEEIHALLAEGSDAGVIEQTEHAMVRNVFRLDERRIGSLMVPRADVLCLDLDLPPEDNLRRIRESGFARFPLVRGDLDHMLGVVSARNWLLHRMRPRTTEPASLPLEPQLNVPETITALDLLEKFRASATHMACVIDEYGAVQGIVTLHDLVEAITGELHPFDVETSWAVQRSDGSWLLDGYIPLPELKDRLGLRSVPDEERGRYHTLSGMIMLLLGRLPRVADTVDWEGWRFEIVDMDGKAIDKVLASRLPVAGEAGAPA